jgi:glycosyltransferase involved in cell wall biosynthesis
MQFVTPLPPVPSGIAQYSRDVLQVVDGAWPISVVTEDGSDSGRWREITVRSRRDRKRFDPRQPTIFQLGNSGYHQFAYDQALRQRAVLVLHDVVLHHGRLAHLLRRHDGRRYRRIMRQRYGAEGREAADHILRGQLPPDLVRFPLCEDYVERAAVTVVHNAYARDLVEQLVPGAPVLRIPMGIPLPVLVERREARDLLRLPHYAFILASITHVNPHKRLPVVFRALRRVIDRLPDVLLVVAGSVAPGIDLARLARFHNVERHVRVLGYVSDPEARLLARAADACVNLRHPSAGETSASLLRLLGAGRPVMVTDDATTREYPPNSVLPVPVDRFEDEMLAELILMLADSPSLRDAAGHAARAFVEREHTMQACVAGYQEAVRLAYGLELPAVDGSPTIEADPILRLSRNDEARYSSIDAAVADALWDLRLSRHQPSVDAVARRLVELGLHHVASERGDGGNDESVAANSSRAAGDSGMPCVQDARSAGR